MAESDWKAYQYTPSLIAAVVSCALFAVVTIVIIAQLTISLRSKRASKESKRLLLSLLPFIFGGATEVLGYIGRMMSHNDTEKLGPFIMQAVLLLVAPALLAATIYMTLGRIIWKIDCSHHSIIPLKWLTKFFVVGDVLSFFMQGTGGGLTAGDSWKLGENLIIAGLFVQVAFFLLFLVVLVIFQIRVSNDPSSRAISLRYEPSNFRNWQTIILSLFVCSGLIFIRSIVRVVEYLQGNDGYIISHEVYIYVLDALPMFLTMVIFSSQDISRYYTIMFLDHSELLMEEEGERKLL